MVYGANDPENAERPGPSMGSGAFFFVMFVKNYIFRSLLSHCNFACNPVQNYSSFSSLRLLANSAISAAATDARPVPP